MNLEEIPFDDLMRIIEEMSIDDIINLCQSSQFFNESVCKNEDSSIQKMLSKKRQERWHLVTAPRNYYKAVVGMYAYDHVKNKLYVQDFGHALVKGDPNYDFELNKLLATPITKAQEVVDGSSYDIYPKMDLTSPSKRNGNMGLFFKNQMSQPTAKVVDVELSEDDRPWIGIRLHGQIFQIPVESFVWLLFNYESDENQERMTQNKQNLVLEASKSQMKMDRERKQERKDLLRKTLQQQQQLQKQQEISKMFEPSKSQSKMDRERKPLLQQQPQQQISKPVLEFSNFRFEK